MPVIRPEPEIARPKVLGERIGDFALLAWPGNTQWISPGGNRAIASRATVRQPEGQFRLF
jgi:hypothetical protein